MITGIDRSLVQSTLATAFALSLSIAGCGSNTTTPNGTDAGPTGTDTGTTAPVDGNFVGFDVNTNPTDAVLHTFSDLPPPPTCTLMNAFTIVFSPMYSAYDGIHRFQVPAVVNGVNQADVYWSSDNAAVATTAPDPVSGGTMITVTGSGMVNIQAQFGNTCATAALNITTAETGDWDVGSMRYNDGINYVPPSRRPDAAVPDGSSSMDPACTNCHGPTSTNRQYMDISHTPEQIGGFSDSDLQLIIRTGTVPDGGYFDTSIVTLAMWHSFHQWTMTDDELRGVIVYLRSLTPVPQAGSSNFGGRFGGGDGGMGFGMRDASVPPG